MHYVDEDHWQVSLPLSVEEARAVLNYSYVFADTDGSRREDWGRDRYLAPSECDCQDLLVLDSWNEPGYVENVFYTEPFKKVLLAENLTAVKTETPPSPTHTFFVKAPLLKKNQTLCLVGQGSVLGHWSTKAPVLLGHKAGDDYFSVTLDLHGQPFPFEYKYGVYDVEKKAFIEYEDGANRILRDGIAPHRQFVVADGVARLPFEPWRGAGVAVPVFALRTEKSFGVGEFCDLKTFADWGKKTGLKLIQLLPINDTSATGTWHDSYPYAAISAFALHPIYLNVAAVADEKNKALLSEAEPERQRLNALDALDYEAVMKAKLDLLRKIFPAQQATTLRSAEYKQFYTANESWLAPYAAFCFLRDKYGTADFNQWPEHKQFNAERIAALAKNNDDVAFHCFIQFHLHVQLREAADYVHAAGMVLKGDLAIGVYRYSADVWQSPELYHLDLQAGAPPDPFSAKGQNWGFPTYNWPRMAADGFAWWKQRFAQMSNYVDAFRIDHILGFFRIWSSPAHAVEGILGYFVPALAIEPAEFAQRGIHFDRERLIKPFITDRVLSEIFADDAELVRREFLISAAPGQYALKPEFSTQRQVEKLFTSQLEESRRLKIGLFNLISNVILLEVDGKYHFRFSMEQTPSFKHLPVDQQMKLRELYVDYFFRRQDDFWRREAMKKLPALKRVTNMLICGEDLGLVPACVPDVMRELGFLGLEIQRMPKKLRAQFSHPSEAAYLSVVTPGTHDMSTIRGWWEEDRGLTQTFYNRELGMVGTAPTEAEPWIVQAVVRQHLQSPAIWSVFQIQDLLGMDSHLRRPDVAAERINVPAVPNFYWCYRMHLPVEKLTQADDFNDRLKQMIREAGR